jgi:HEAT repeat protein
VAEAATALGQFGREAAAAVPTLIEVLREIAVSTTDRGGAELIKSLGAIAPGTASTDEAVTGLTLLLRSKSDNIRYWAVRTLPLFGSKGRRAIPQLRALKTGASPLIRKAAAAALKALAAVD